MHLADPQLARLAKHLDSSSTQAGGTGPVSACKATGLTDQHKDWSLQENAQVGAAQQHSCLKDLDSGPGTALLQIIATSPYRRYCVTEGRIQAYCITADTASLQTYRRWLHGFPYNSNFILLTSNPQHDVMKQQSQALVNASRRRPVSHSKANCC